MIEFGIQLCILQICWQCGGLARPIEIKRIVPENAQVFIYDMEEEDSPDEERQPLFDDRPTFILTTDEILRQFVEESDKSILSRDTRLAPSISQSEDLHSEPQI